MSGITVTINESEGRVINPVCWSNSGDRGMTIDNYTITVKKAALVIHFLYNMGKVVLFVYK